MGKLWSCAWGLGLVLLLSEAGVAMPEPMILVQQGETAPTDETRAAAERAFDEGMELFEQGTAESLWQAIEKWEVALGLWRELGEREWEAATLLGIGRVYSDLGEKQKALEYFEQSLPLSQAVGNRAGEAATLNNIGGVYSALGEKHRALEYYEQALPLRRAVGDRAGEATTLTNIGSVYSDLGEKQKALEYYEQSLPLSQAVGDRAVVATTLNNIGLVYSDLGEKQKALEYYEQSLPLSQAVGDRAGEATTLTNIGGVYDALGEKQRALEYYEQSLPLFQAVGARAGEAVTLNNIGLVYNALGEKQTALEYYEQSLPLSQAVGDRSGEATTLNNIGLVYDALGEKQRALEYYEQSLPLFQAVGDRAGEAATLTNIAVAERDLGNLQTALAQIQAAIDIIEDLRTNIGSQELRASYFAQNQHRYEFYILLLMRLHRQNPESGYDSQALHISERARARGLLELLTEANADIRQGVDPSLLERERTLQQQLNAADTRRTQLLKDEYTQTQLDAVKQEIDNLLNQLQTLEGQIRATSPRYAELQYPEPLTLEEIQQQILDDDTLLLQYSLGETVSYLWAVSKTGITSYELPPRAEIEAAAQPFLEYLKSPTGTNPESGIPLSQILLEPVAEQLNGQRLLIVGDGILQTIPFAALPIPGGSMPLTPTLLLENHEIATLPSASSLAISRRELANRPVAPKTLAVLADPVFSCLGDDRIANSPACETADTIDPTFNNNPTQPWNSATRAAEFLDTACTSFDRLKYTQTEAESILSLVPENQRFQATGFDASRATATSDELANYQIVHLATHGCVGKEHPSLHGIVLSLFDADGTPQDGFLRLQDIFNLNLPAELVVLSACQTGIGDNVKGEGIVGLTRGFMYAGAKRVAVSLWSVNDYATSELMEQFYQEMLDGGLTATAAMRAAQLEMMRAGKPAYEWAAFVVQGEWRQDL
ncbi:MAG: tetratricopeptide repeat protein [Cyanobacteriota bacterium]|nr:tetratricopeptide repeat protein [Cyanobacteriota bacterium]